MTKHLLCFTLFLLMCLSILSTVAAREIVVNIPDPNLRTAIETALDKVSGDRVTLTDMANLTELKKVQNANIHDLTGLEGATNLTKLNLGVDDDFINSNSVSDISPLAELTNLTQLRLDDNNISDISPVAGLTNLTVLGLDDNNISDISAVAGLTNLTVLGLSNNNISDISPVANLTNLTELRLSGNSISNISTVAGLTNLTVLGLSNNNISDISPGANLTNLISLRLSGNSISNISTVANLTNLISLRLDDNNISDISAVAGLTNLTVLGLGDNNISDISPGANLTNLTELGLSGNSISNISTVANLTNLISLDFEHNSISDISSVAGLTNLVSLLLWDNFISDISPLAANTGLGSGDTVDVQGNFLSYFSLHTHIPILQEKGVVVYFDNQAHPVLVKISGDNQTGMPSEVLVNPFVVEVHGASGSVLAGVSVIFDVTTGSGTLSTQSTTTDENGRAQSTLTLGPNLGTNTVQVSAAGIQGLATFHTIADTLPTEYLWSIPSGISLIHVPLQVTAIDGVAKTIESISDLYDALGGASKVFFLATHDSQTQEWAGYFGPADKGTPVDKGLTDGMGILANMIAPTSVRLSGNPLGTNGTSTITLNPEFNVVGLPLRDSSISRVSDLLALDGIRDNVHAILFTDNGDFKLVIQATDPSNIPIVEGQAFMLYAQRAETVTISGEGWTNTSGTAAAPSMALTGIEVGDTTPVLGLRGAVVGKGTGLKVDGFRVTVKNLSTRRAVTAVTAPDEPDYRLTVVDIETGRAATIGDTLEISAQSPNPFIGVEPLRYTITAEDVKRSRIQLPELVVYEIPTETQLLPNYPNPFNPETWIPYRLAEDAFVTLAIYDQTGQIVRILDVGHQIAAVYEGRSKAVYWDGRNKVGETVASGVYFYHLSAGDYSATRKMLIIK